MPNNLSREELTRLVRLGAQARLEQLNAERQAMLGAFPDLAAGGRQPRGRRPRRRPAAKPQAAQATKPTPKRRGMSPAQRKAVSERMKKYWAERRKAKAAPAKKIAKKKE